MASRPPLPELDWEAMTAEEILGALLEAFPGRISLACSFQKEESVLLDMLYAHRAGRPGLRARHARPLPRDLRASGARSSAGTGRRSRSTRARRSARQAEIHGERALGDASPTSAARSARSSRSAARSAGSTPGSPASAATSRRRAPTRRRSAGTRRTSSGRRTRSPTGTTSAAGTTSASAACPTTRSTSGATPRSAARTARSRAPAARAAGPGTGKTECGLHVVEHVSRLRPLAHGLSAAGKSTIAGLVAAELEARGVLVDRLDGDVVRTH